MVLVSAAVAALDSDQDAHATAAKLADVIGSRAELASELLIGEPGVAAHALRPSDAAGRRMTTSRPDDQTVIFGLPASVHVAGAVIAQELRDPGSRTEELPHGRWIALRAESASAPLRALVDPFGTAWLYHARQRHGHLLASDFGALVSAHDGPLTVDYGALLGQLATGNLPAEATAFREVAAVPAGSVVELGVGDARVLSRRRQRYGDAYAGWTRERKLDRLAELLSEALLDWTDGTVDDVVVSLSGGNDSPFAVAGLLELGARPRCATWGGARTENARIAGRLTGELGLPWTLVERPTATWPGWLGWFQAVGTGGFDWSGWADEWHAQLAQLGTGTLMGYLGDALSGKHLVETQSAEGSSADWLTNWLGWISRGRWLDSPLFNQAARGRIGALVRGQLATSLDGIETAFPHQRALQLDLHGRQRRLIAAQLGICARFLAPLTFFYTRGMLDFWTNLDWPDQRAQSLYLDFGRQRNGRVYGIVLEERHRREHGRPLARLTRRARLRLVSMLPGYHRELAPTGNDLLGSQLRFKAEIRALVAAVEPLLAPVIDVTALRRELDRYPSRTWLTPLRLNGLVAACSQLALAR